MGTRAKRKYAYGVSLYIGDEEANAVVFYSDADWTGALFELASEVERAQRETGEIYDRIEIDREIN